MKVIYNSLIPFKGFTAINIFGVLFARKGAKITEKTINHESIHTAQMREMLYILFYVFYILEWLIKLFRYGRKAYENISFEREAYAYQSDYDYLHRRRHYTWLRRIEK